MDNQAKLSLLGAWMALFVVFAARKFQQPIKVHFLLMFIVTFVITTPLILRFTSSQSCNCLPNFVSSYGSRMTLVTNPYSCSMLFLRRKRMHCFRNSRKNGQIRNFNNVWMRGTQSSRCWECIKEVLELIGKLLT